MPQTIRDRLGWAALLGLSAGVLVASRWLTPSPAGLGTHTQLGLPACGFLRLFGRPCPACGLTTAFAHAARFSLHASLAAHPLGALLFAGVCALGARALLGMCGLGNFAAFCARPVWPRLALSTALALFAAWVVRLME